MDMFSLLAASLTLVSTTPDCRIGLASDYIVSPLSTPAHYHPVHQVEPGTVTHFFTSGSPQWGFDGGGANSTASSASSEADLSRLHLRAIYLGCNVGANRSELESLARTLEQHKAAQDWSRLGGAYINTLLYEIYASIGAQGDERERLNADLVARSRSEFETRYFNAITSLAGAYEEALTAIAAGDYGTYLASLRTMADSHDSFQGRREYEELSYYRPTEYDQNEHNIGVYSLYLTRSYIIRVIAARVRALDFEASGGMPWQPEEFAVFEDALGGNLPEEFANHFGSLAAYAAHSRRSSDLHERVIGHSVFSTFLYMLNAREASWSPPYEHSPYLWAQYQLALYEVTSAVHDLWYDPETDQPGIHAFTHSGYICAAEARLDAARNVLDGLFDLDLPSRCEPVVGDRVLIGVD